MAKGNQKEENKPEEVVTTPEEEVNPLEKALKNCFEANPETETLFQTSDGQCFYTYHEAREHGRRLEDSEVTEHGRA